MNAQDSRKDLIVLVADKDMEMSMKGILERTAALGTRKISYDIFTHARHDPGCYLSSHTFLHPFSNPSSYSYCIVMFDREGCGNDDERREDLESEVEQRLTDNGWGDRAKAIVLDPELEIWVWSDSPHVRDVLGWQKDIAGFTLYRWLQEQGFIQEGNIKPARPKEAMEAAIRFARKAKSPANFLQLAQRVSFKSCKDPSLLKLRLTLQTWFPA